MKTGALFYCFCLSLLAHGAAVGVVLLLGSSQGPGDSPTPAPPAILTVITVPDPPAVQAGEAPAAAPPRLPEPPPLAPPRPPQPLSRPPGKAEPVPAVLPSAEAVLTHAEHAPQARPSTASSSADARVVGANRIRDKEAGVGSAETEPVAEVGMYASASYRNQREPRYPPAARRRGQEGTVLLGIRVTSAGTVARVEVKQSSGFPLLDAAAVKAVRSWDFEPARIGSQRVSSEVEVPMHFRLAR